jgi:hypothetical protein
MSYVMTFGKHKGKKIDRIPIDYLDWIVNDAHSISGRFKRMIQHEIDRRRGNSFNVKPRDPDRKPVSYGDPIESHEPFPWALEPDAGCPFDPGSNHPGFGQMNPKDIEFIRGVLGDQWMKGEEKGRAESAVRHACSRCAEIKPECEFDRTKKGARKNVCSECSKYLSKRTREGMRKKFEGATR